MKSLLDLPRRKQMSLGVYIGDTDVAVAEMAALAGFDYMRIDSEHSMSDPSKLSELIRVANAADIPSLVRVSNLSEITKFLDCGASGIMVPDIETVQQVQAAVDCCKYAPVGKRGMANIARAVNYGGRPFDEYMRQANETIALCIQIESVEGIEHAQELISIDGVDMVTVGRWDLSQSMGLIGQTNHPKVVEAENYVIETALRYGKYPLVTANTPERAEALKVRGVYCATICYDTQFISNAFRELVSRFRE